MVRSMKAIVPSLVVMTSKEPAPSEQFAKSENYSTLAKVADKISDYLLLSTAPAFCFSYAFGGGYAYLLPALLILSSYQSHVVKEFFEHKAEEAMHASKPNRVSKLKI
jgi:hypothetical protein